MRKMKSMHIKKKSIIIRLLNKKRNTYSGYAAVIWGTTHAEPAGQQSGTAMIVFNFYRADWGVYDHIQGDILV